MQCWRPPVIGRHYVSAQKFVFVSAELGHNRSPLMLESDKDVCCRHSSSQFIWIAQTVTVASTRVSWLEAAWSIVCFLRTNVSCLHPLKWVFNLAHLIGFLFHATKPEIKSALTRPRRFYVSPETQGSSPCKWAVIRIHCSRWRRSSTLGWYLQLGDGRRNEEVDTRMGKANALQRELYRSAVTKRELASNTKLSIFKPVFAPILTYGEDESWAMIERILSPGKASEMGFCEAVFPLLAF